MDTKTMTVGGIILVVVIIGGLYVMNQDATTQKTGIQPSTHQPDITITTSTPDQAIHLGINDLKVGTGREVKNGDTVTVNYNGTLTNGTKFDSSYDRKQPFTFTVGEKKVIAGWEQGLIGMKIGGKRALTIPPELGYGAQPVGTIPANSTLVFEIELLAIK